MRIAVEVVAMLVGVSVLAGGRWVLMAQAPARAREVVVPADDRMLAVPSIGEDSLRRLALVSGRWAGVQVAAEIAAKPFGELDTKAWAVPEEPEAGRTVAALLDALVARDSRYSWREVGTVAVVRPVDAWEDPSHLLHRRTGPIDLKDVATSEAVEAIFRLFGEPTGRGGGEVPLSKEPALDEAMKVEARDRRVSVRLKDASILEVERKRCGARSADVAALLVR